MATASWRPPKHTGGRARKCGARAPRLGPTASAWRCRIGPITYNCYWENAEGTPSARGRDERGGRPAVLPVSEPESPGGRSRLLPSNRPKRAAARLRCTTSPLLATETSPRLYRQCRDAGRGPAGKPLLGDIQTYWSLVGPRPSVSFRAAIYLGGAGFLLVSPSEIVQPGPITAARPPRIRRRHAPSPGALRPVAWGQIPRRWAHRQARGREGLL
jgi:hypothetical protein